MQATGNPDCGEHDGHDVEAIAAALGTTPHGLSSEEATRRLVLHGPNELTSERPITRARILWNQLRSPLIFLLLFAAAASAATGEWVDALIVIVIVVASTWIGFSRESSAHEALMRLRDRVRARATALRDGAARVIAAREVVPGDVIVLAAGSVVPGDAVLIEATDLFVDESALTGESFPVEKLAAATAHAHLGDRSSCVYQGTNVRSGTAQAIVVHTGARTRFGAIAKRLQLRAPETEFDRGLRRFGYLLTIAMTVLVLVVFAVNVITGRPPIETLLFSIALAVGLSPELLPIVLGVNLARGAQNMSRRGVLVRRLSAIENLGSMDVLCTDKTGTLTEGVVQLDGAFDVDGTRSPEVLELAALNATYQGGLANPLDDAIRRVHSTPVEDDRKLGEIPYDFVRKRLSVVLREGEGARLVMKGAFEHVLEVCSRGADDGPLDEQGRAALRARFVEWSCEGTRVLAVATRSLTVRSIYGREDERDLRFVGFLTFLDQPKRGASEAIADLGQLGVSVKLITGDARLVAEHIAGKVGLGCGRVLTGKQLDELRDEALWHAAEVTDLFVEVDPNQKERIILALKKTGHVVGFLGDGINDAPAMHAADTGISVEGAADVARDAADFVLLERRLDVIRAGIEEGRRTFANTLKYILTTMSANLGNMVSMALASIALPFLPMLAGQILLNNFLSDVPAVGLADDDVDPELVERPRRWNMRGIARFMVRFGLLSSVFDVVTFVVLARVFAAPAELFRTAWFVESLLTELVVALVVRTQRPFYRSRPGPFLLRSTLVLVPLAFCIPFLPGAALLGFVPLPVTVCVAIIAITAAYVLATERLKQRFFAKERHAESRSASP